MNCIPEGEEPWVAAHVYIDEFGNSFNDPTQDVFGFAGIVFASNEHKNSLLAEAQRRRITGPRRRNPRGSNRSAEEAIIDDVLDLLNPSGSSTLSADKVLVCISHVALRDPRIRDLIEHGRQSVIWNGVAYLTPELSDVSGSNWIWIRGALMSLLQAVYRVVHGHGQFLAELHVTYDERCLDRLTRSVLGSVIRRRFIGKGPIEGMKRLFDNREWEAIDRRVFIQRLRVKSASDEVDGALRVAHWVARAAFRGLNPAGKPAKPEWVSRIVAEHGAYAASDITRDVLA